MVNTRRSGPVSSEKTGKGSSKANKANAKPSHDSDQAVQPVASKRQRLQFSEFIPGNKDGRQTRTPAEDKYEMDMLSPPKTRSRVDRGRIKTTTKAKDHKNSPIFSRERHKKGVRAERPPTAQDEEVFSPMFLREKHKRESSAGGRDELRTPMRELESSSQPRRSDRRRRKVYDTLNETILKQQQCAQTHEHLFGDENNSHRRSEALDDSLGERSEEKKHDTPSPEKRRKLHNRKHLESDGDDEGDDSDNDDDDDDDDDEEEEDGDEESQRKRYLLRQKRPTTNRYMAPPMKRSRERRSSYMNYTERIHRQRDPPPHASPIRRIHRRRRNTMNKGSSTSSSDESCDQDERKFERRKSRSMAKARERCLPMNFGMEDLSGGVLKDRRKIGSSLADVDPMNIDRKVTFDSVGGLGRQIRALKEMILFPLLYTEVFEKFKISPPRGVLFHGPPGTGKTLVARALANECSQGGKKVAFFMRKGADCLSKWVGESERQLRLLFDQAFSMRPSIIFFDEIDGLAPVRSSRQDQIHSSIVSTLLALMDGLDSRGEIVVIGATNRIDAIDPALRRPGRFDREFRFPLPDKSARRTILSIHTREWEPKLLPAFIDEVADRCVGYCGADIKALCTEAALLALRRRYPQIYSSEKKLLLDVDSIEVSARDFDKAMKMIVPASQRSVASPARMLSNLIRPLMSTAFYAALDKLRKLFSPAHLKTDQEASPCAPKGNPCINRSEQRTKDSVVLSEEEDTSEGEEGVSICEPRLGSERSERYTRRMRQRVDAPGSSNSHTSAFFSSFENLLQSATLYRPRLMICGKQGMGQSTHLAPALLHATEHLIVHCLDLPTLYGVACKTPEEACSQLFREARRTTPCVLYIPHVDTLWACTTESLQCTFMSLLQDLPPLSRVLLLATADETWSELPAALQQLFSRETGQVFQMTLPTCEERKAFFQSLFLEYAAQPPKVKKARKERMLEVLAVAPTPPPRQLTESEMTKVRQDEEGTLRELRIFLREIHTKLIMDRRFKEFSKPVDLEEITDYMEVVDEPMDLSTMMQNINSHRYMTCAQYLLDIDLITCNALKYNPNRDPLDKVIRHRACELRDLAHSAIQSQLEPEFEKACEDIIASKERRGEKPTTGAPAYIFIAPARSAKPSTETRAPAEVEVTNQVDTEEQRGPDAVHETTDAQHKKPALKRYRGRPKKRLSRRNLNIDMAQNDVDDDAHDDAHDDEHDDAHDDEHDAHDDVKQTDDDDDDDAEEEKHGGDNDKEPRRGLACKLPRTEDVNEATNVVESAATLLPFSDDEVLENGDVDSVTVSSEVNHIGDDDEVALLYEVDEYSDSRIDGKSVLSHEDRKRAESDGTDAHFLNGVSLPPGSNAPLYSITQKHIGNGEIDTNDEESESQANANSNQSVRNNDTEELKLKQLLAWLVEITHSASVECLERYHSALQQCIYQHRHSQDKSQLTKELEKMIQTFSTSLQTAC